MIESITPDSYTYFDKTDNRTLGTWSASNVLGFVPLWPAYNEYDVTLGGGQSDIEPILPFIQAFHEVLLQTLAAHKYHSTPKAKFKLKDIYPFLKNNFPNVIDDNGRIIPNAEISWGGREIFFLMEGEDIDFVEARSVLGDSKTLLEFLIDCIIIAAEVPKWAILKDQGSTDKDATVQPFEKKVARKRVMFNDIIVMLVKMTLVANGRTPNTPKLVWPAIRLADLAAKAQSFQQIVLAGDVASAHEWIADETMTQIISGLFPEVNAPSVEKALAKDNVQPSAPAPAPASDTQGAQQPPLPPQQQPPTNGKGSKKQAQKALATTTPSRN